MSTFQGKANRTTRAARKAWKLAHPTEANELESHVDAPRRREKQARRAA